MDAKVFSLDGNVVKTVKLPEDIFSVEVNESAIHESVKEYLNNQRQGTASTKTRVEVAGGGKKPWRQKGLGRARAGTIRSPLWRGGGITFGPKPRDYYYRINKKVRKLALKSALTIKAQQEKIFVIEDTEIETPKTSTMAQLTGKMDILKDQKKLFVFDKYIPNSYKSVRNLSGSLPVMAHEINTYIIMNSDYVIISESGLEKIKEVFAK